MKQRVNQSSFEHATKLVHQELKIKELTLSELQKLQATMMIYQIIQETDKTPSDYLIEIIVKTIENEVNEMVQ